MHCLGWPGENTEWALMAKKLQIHAGRARWVLCGNGAWGVGLHLTAPGGSPALL